MRAISLHQPHASFVAYGFKPFETRSWKTSYTGPVLIHASARKMTPGDVLVAKDILGVAYITDAVFPLGAFVCVAQMGRCTPTSHLTDEEFKRCNGLGDFSAGRFVFPLSDVRRFVKPIPAKGRQRWWDFVIDPDDHDYVDQPWRRA